nr:MAG TPA: hypothetical protein [Bacteriophage sp.]
MFHLKAKQSTTVYDNKQKITSEFTRLLFSICCLT